MSKSSQVTWILERNVFAEISFDRFLKHFKENNIPYHVVTILPFIHTLEKSLPHIEGPVVVYGTFNSAGLYECDIGNLVDSINAFVTGPNAV